MGSIKGCPRGEYTKRLPKPGTRVYCSNCNKGFKRKIILEHHIKTKHLNYRICCPVCHRKYISKSVWYRHMKKVHTVKSCSKFDVTFKPSHELLKPEIQKLHSEEEESIQDDPLFLKMSFEADKVLPSLANVLMIKKNEFFGSHVVAKCNIDVGKVLVVSNPFASIECASSSDFRCFQCGEPRDIKFIKCPHCIDVYFCSRKCSLNKFHASKCNKMFTDSDCHIIRLATEVIKTAFEKVGYTDQFVEYVKGIVLGETKFQKCRPPYSTYGQILNLKTASGNDHFVMAHRVVDCIWGLPKIRASIKTDLKRLIFCMASRHIATIKINSFSEEFTVGKGVCTRYSLHDALSIINHSCAPNLHHYYDTENVIRCVSIRPIRKGDQIFISYLGDMKFNDDISRKSYIKKNWSFDCECEMCHHDIHANQPGPLYKYIKNNFELKKNFHPQYPSCLVDNCKKYLNQYGHSWSNAVDFVVSCFIFLIHNIHLSD